MSSSDDSETKEWENEQMLRGTQSRARNRQQAHTPRVQASAATGGSDQSPNQNIDVVDATRAKNYVTQDINEAEADIKAIKSKIGSSILAISRSEKRISDMKKQIEKLDASNPFFEELKKLTESRDVLNLLDRNRQLISRLPSDQKETIDLLEDRMKVIQHLPVDDQYSRKGST